MEKIKTVGFSKKHEELGRSVDVALRKVSKKLIQETKKENGYLVVADKKGIVKKIPAKDLWAVLMQSWKLNAPKLPDTHIQNNCFSNFINKLCLRSSTTK